MVDSGRYIEQAIGLAGNSGSLEALGAQTLGERLATLDRPILGDDLFRKGMLPADWQPTPFGFERVIGASCGMAITLFTQGDAHHVMLGVMALEGSGLEGMMVTLADGTPLPDHIRVSQQGLIVIQKTEDGGPIDLQVRLMMTDGTVLESRMRINGATGEILFATEPRRCEPTGSTLSVLGGDTDAFLAALRTFA
jgi:hypothetical protein